MHYDHPFAGRLMPECFRIAVDVFDIRQDWIALVWSERAATVVTVRDRLAEGLALRPRTSPAGGCIDRYYRLFFPSLEAGTVVLVQHGRTRIDRAQMVRVNDPG